MSFFQALILSSLLNLKAPRTGPESLSEFNALDLRIAAHGTTPLSASDQNRFNQILQMAQAQKLATQPLGTVVQAIARQFLGAPYQAGLLDQSPTEKLFISLQRFDCVLLIETVLALARNIIAQDNSPTNFAHHIEAQRYRTGHLKDYCSRLHYFSDWIADGERRGLVRNLTPSLGGISLHKPLNFMTQHRSSYPQLQNNSAALNCLKQVEMALNRQSLTYITTAKIRTVYPQLQSGDIVAIATAIPGLDVTHTGFVERRADGGVGIIHASPAGSVTRSVDLQTYASRVQDAIGIIIARPLLPPLELKPQASKPKT